jgi:hypothetical protein
MLFDCQKTASREHNLVLEEMILMHIRLLKALSKWSYIGFPLLSSVYPRFVPHLMTYVLHNPMHLRLNKQHNVTNFYSLVKFP